MASFSLAFMADNAAFTDDGAQEVARILRNIANKVGVGRQTSGKITDVNGNHVGSWVYDAPEPADETEE